MNGKNVSLILLDTNIIIYARQPEGALLADLLAGHDLATNLIIEIEVLCGAQLDDEDTSALKTFLDSMHMLVLDSRVVQQAIAIRKHYKTKLPDALVAATALAYDVPLWTHNTKDFKHIAGLSVYDPMNSKKP